MDEKINYSNPILEQKLKKLFEDSYGTLQPIIIDILLKRKYAFKLTEEQSLKEAKRFIDNVDRVEIGRIFEKNCYGNASVNERNIRISDKFLKNFKSILYKYSKNLDEFYSFLVHEIFHQLSFHYEYYDEKTNEIIMENCTEENINKNENNSNVILSTGIEEEPASSRSYSTTMMEVFNECGSGMIYSNKKDIFSYSEMGYEQLSFLPHLLSAAIGTTDNKLIYASLVSASEFNKIIYGQYRTNIRGNENALIVEKLIKSVDLNIDMLYGMIYSRNYSISKYNEAIKLKKSLFEKIISTTYTMANFQIETDKRSVSKELLDELLVRYKKMDKSMLIASKKLELLNVNKYNDIYKTKENMLIKIFGIYVVNQLKDKINDENVLEKYTVSAKKGKIFELAEEINSIYDLDLEELKKDSFIKYIKAEKYKDSQYYRSLETDDMFNYKKWDDKKVYDMINVFFESIKESYKNFRKPNIMMKKPLNIIGLALGRLYSTYSNINENEAINKIVEDTGISESEVIEFLDATKGYTEVCYEQLNSIGMVTQENEKIIVGTNREFIRDFKIYYQNFLRFLNSKVLSSKDPFEVKEILRTEIGVRNIKRYSNSVLKKLKKSGIISDGEIKEYNEYNKSMEDMLNQRIRQFYVLSKLKRTKEYEPTFEDIESAKCASLFTKKNKPESYDFSRKFNENEFQKAVQKQYKKDEYLLVLEDFTRIPQGFKKSIKRIKLLPEARDANKVKSERSVNKKDNKQKRGFRDIIKIKTSNNIEINHIKQKKNELKEENIEK